jgi:hypothetical protein
MVGCNDLTVLPKCQAGNPLRLATREQLHGSGASSEKKAAAR